MPTELRMASLAFGVTLGVLVGIFPCFKLFSVYYGSGEPITFMGYIFRRGAGDDVSRAQEIDLGSYALPYKGGQPCLPAARRALQTIGKVSRVDNETVSGRHGLSRIAIRCQSNGVSTVAIVYGASFDGKELERSLHELIREIQRDR